MLVVQDGLVGANANIQVAVGGRLPEKLDMAAVEQVITAADKYFLSHRIQIPGQAGNDGR